MCFCTKTCLQRTVCMCAHPSRFILLTARIEPHCYIKKRKRKSIFIIQAWSYFHVFSCLQTSQQEASFYMSQQETLSRKSEQEALFSPHVAYGKERLLTDLAYVIKKKKNVLKSLVIYFVNIQVFFLWFCFLILRFPVSILNICTCSLIQNTKMIMKENLHFQPQNNDSNCFNAAVFGLFFLFFFLVGPRPSTLPLQVLAARLHFTILVEFHEHRNMQKMNAETEWSIHIHVWHK